jgi:hypothetical protein
MMRRREVITLLGSAAACRSLRVRRRKTENGLPS